MLGRFPRRRSNLPVEVTLLWAESSEELKKTTYGGVVRNVGEGGVLLETYIENQLIVQQLAAKTLELRLFFVLPPGVRVVARCRVVRLSSDNALELGLAFIDLDKNMARALRQYVNRDWY